MCKFGRKCFILYNKVSSLKGFNRAGFHCTSFFLLLVSFLCQPNFENTWICCCNAIQNSSETCQVISKPVCEKIFSLFVALCPRPSIPSNSIDWVPIKNYYNNLESIRLVCVKGFTTVGNSLATCGPNGSFDMLPECQGF